MFKKIVVCSVAAGLVISLAACGKSDEAKCVEYVKSQEHMFSAMPEDMKKKQFDQMVNQCVAAKKLTK